MLKFNSHAKNAHKKPHFEPLRARLKVKIFAQRHDNGMKNCNIINLIVIKIDICSTEYAYKIKSYR